jgi:hypothetical protein
MKLEKLHWIHQYMTVAKIGPESVEYRVTAVLQELGSTVVFQASVTDRESGLKPLGLPCGGMEEAFQRCDQDLGRRRGQYHDEAIERRVAAFLRKSGIRIDVRPDCGAELDVFWPTHPKLVEETTGYRATLERGHKRLEFPLWAEDMPDESIVLYMAGYLAAEKARFGQHCNEHGLDAGESSTIKRFEQVQQLKREAAGFFSEAEIKQLRELNAPPVATERHCSNELTLDHDGSRSS